MRLLKDKNGFKRIKIIRQVTSWERAWARQWLARLRESPPLPNVAEREQSRHRVRIANTYRGTSLIRNSLP